LALRGDMDKWKSDYIESSITIYNTGVTIQDGRGSRMLRNLNESSAILWITSRKSSEVLSSFWSPEVKSNWGNKFEHCFCGWKLSWKFPPSNPKIPTTYCSYVDHWIIITSSHPISLCHSDFHLIHAYHILTLICYHLFYVLSLYLASYHLYHCHSLISINYLFTLHSIYFFLCPALVHMTFYSLLSWVLYVCHLIG